MTMVMRLALACGLASLAGCAPPPASPARFDYCKRLYQLYHRYHTIPTIVHDGRGRA